MKNRALSLTALLIVVAVAAVATRSLWMPGPPNIILIVVDTLRADHLSGWGHERPTSPVLDAFAADNLKFESAWSTAPWTAPSVASIFTGLYPTAHGVLGHTEKENVEEGDDVSMALLQDRLETTAEALQRAGYRTAGVTANAWVADYLGFAQGFQAFETHDYVTADVVNQRGLTQLDELEMTEQPWFLYLQYMDPHSPYNPPEEDMEGMRGRNEARPYKGRFVSRSNRYDGEIHHVDRKLGEFFDELKRRKLYKRAVVLIVSDHGEQFGERGRGGHGHTLRAWETHVPLLLKAKKRTGVITTPVSIADVHPTLLELGGVEDAAPTQAMSLLSPDLGTRPGVLAEATRHRNHKSIVAPDGHKLILNFKGKRRDIVDRTKQIRRIAHFDVAADPRETTKIEGDSEREDALETGFYSLYNDSVGRRVDGQDQVLTAETIEQLKALGYLD